MRLSQYVETYLNNDGRYTIGTFLHYNLRGRAKSQYADVYEDSLLRSMQYLERIGKVMRCSSVHGGTAWKRATE